MENRTGDHIIVNKAEAIPPDIYRKRIKKTIILTSRKTR